VKPYKSHKRNTMVNMDVEGGFLSPSSRAPLQKHESETSELLQSNLPLLFANGVPTSLESMTLSQLQQFLLFILKCEQGLEVKDLDDVDQPTWWPKDLPFDNSLVLHSTKKGYWSCKIRSLIRKCYAHSNASFLLEFSHRLMICMDRIGKITTEDNGDGTRSMRTVANRELLVTFRAENQDYDLNGQHGSPSDQQSFSTASPLKQAPHLVRNSVSSHNSSDPALPQSIDVFLCDNCGADFQSLDNVLAHEKTCGVSQSLRAEGDSRSSAVLSSLGLRPASPNSSSPSWSATGTTATTVVRPKPSSYTKFLSIDFTSPLGQYILSLGSVGGSAGSINIESLCASDRRGMRSAGIEGFPITYRGPKDRADRKRDHHQYCFTKNELRIRQFTLNKGLTPKCHKKYQELKARQIRILVKRLPFVPKSGTAKLLFDYKKAYEVLINGPREARGKDPAARLVPLVTKLSSSLLRGSLTEGVQSNNNKTEPVSLSVPSPLNSPFGPSGLGLKAAQMKKSFDLMKDLDFRPRFSNGIKSSATAASAAVTSNGISSESSRSSSGRSTPRTVSLLIPDRILKSRKSSPPASSNGTRSANGSAPSVIRHSPTKHPGCIEIDLCDTEEDEDVDIEEVSSESSTTNTPIHVPRLHIRKTSQGTFTSSAIVNS